MAEEKQKERNNRPSAFRLALGCSLGLLVFAEGLVLILQGWDVLALRVATIPALIPWLIVGWVKGRSLMQALVWELEEATNWDINQDGTIGHGHHFVFVSQDTAQVRKEKLLRDMKLFIDKSYAMGTSWRSWKGRTLPSGQKVTQEVWRDFCDALVRANCGHLDAQGQLALDVTREEVYEAFGLDRRL